MTHDRDARSRTAVSAILISTETDRLRLSHNGASLGDYLYLPDDPHVQSPRPYFDGLRTLSGTLVSESHPSDHPWHRGLSWALPVVGAENFWGGPSYVRGQGYVQLENNGKQQHDRFIEGERADLPTGSFVEELQWFSEVGDHLLSETRTVTFSVADSASWVMTFGTVMTNVSPSMLAFGSPTTKGRPNGGYGGLFWRGPHQLLHAQAISPGGAGKDELRGSRAPWMGISGLAGTVNGIEAAGVTVVMVDGPTNLRTPPEWFVGTEDYICLCPAPFFSIEYELEPGERLNLDYAVVIADGSSDTERGAALAQLGYASLPGGMHDEDHRVAAIQEGEA
jgi:hypothetical protein